ncbi:Outer membrane protein TolC [Gammaproteobacteria bacterium]
MKLFVVGALSILVIPSLAEAEDLMAVYRLALERDPQLAAAAAARDSTLEAVPQAKSGFLPTISAGADLNRNRQKTTYGDPSALGPAGSTSGRTLSFSGHDFSLNITQPVYHRETSIALDQSNIRVSQANAEYGAARQDLMVRVAQRYFDVLAALDSLETAQAEKLAVARQLEQSKQRFAVGLIAITDVHEAQASYDLTVAQEIAAENQVANAREALREVTGTHPGDLAPLSRKAPLVSPDPTDADRWADTAVAQNLTLVAARFQTETAQKQVEIQRSGHYPRLDAVGNFRLQTIGGGGSVAGTTDTDSSAIGLQLSIPLYQGGLVDSRVRQAAADYGRARDLLEQGQRATVLAARKAYLGVIAGISRVKALNQAVISNQSALQATEAGYQVGTRTIVDVLNANRLLFTAERDYSQARYDYTLNTLRLKQAAGQLDDPDLQAVNTWLGDNH